MRLFFLTAVALFQSITYALVVSDRAQMARGRLVEALKSPSGKLTLSSEIVIPDPSDPTAILLQSSLITTLSQTMRTKAKANAVFCSGSVTALQTFCNEQESARGNFPSPLPLVYCDETDDLSAVSDAGAEGLLVAVCNGKAISSPGEISSDSSWSETCKKALENGLQPIPEITIDHESTENWKEEDTESLISKIAGIVGEDPAAVLLTVSSPKIVETEGDDDDDDNKEEVETPEVSLPQVPKALSKKITILGSVQSKAGSGRMGEETVRFKDAGFTGAVLRQECIPQISMSQDLEYLSGFWSAAIGDLKSLKSKTFNFRSKNNMEKDLGTEWAKYQLDVIQSGALGEEEHVSVNSEGGDYQGF